VTLNLRDSAPFSALVSSDKASQKRNTGRSYDVPQRSGVEAEVTTAGKEVELQPGGHACTMTVSESGTLEPFYIIRDRVRVLGSCPRIGDRETATSVQTLYGAVAELWNCTNILVCNVIYICIYIKEMADT
jgi:hypothetical protein